MFAGTKLKEMNFAIDIGAKFNEAEFGMMFQVYSLRFFLHMHVLFSIRLFEFFFCSFIVCCMYAGS